MTAIITYYIHAQKTPNLFNVLLTPEVLTDITYRVTGQINYVVNPITTNYNRGRLITIEYSGCTHYITLSEIENLGRNSSLQSVPTALNIFFASTRPNKRLYYYFLPHSGNLFTDYHVLYYRLMLTAGITFLNMAEYSPYIITPYSDVDTLIQDRNQNRESNSGNNSSFVSRTADRVQIYAKVYGANKYESTIIGVALSKISSMPIDLFAVAEQDLIDLPAPSKHTLHELGINLYQTTLRLNNSIESSPNADSLRDAAYIYNLLNRIGGKKCAVCGCVIPEIIQGAHIWGVSDIKHAVGMDFDVKYHHATNGHNGIWLCQNHHKLFDSNIMVINNDGDYLVKRSLPMSHVEFIRECAINRSLATDIMSDELRYYLNIRNANIALDSYERIAL